VKGLPFGLASAPNTFCRIPALLCAAARVWAGVVCDAYVDDYICVDVDDSPLLEKCLEKSGQRHSQLWTSSGQWALNQIHDMVGLELEPKKHKPASSKNVLLGVEADLSKFATKRTISFSPTKARKKEILHDLETCKRLNKLTPRQAAAFLGRLNFTLSTAYTSVGRAATQPLVDRSRARYEAGVPLALSRRRHAWTPSMTHMLVFFTELFANFPPLTFDISKRKRPKVVVYTDASFSSERNGLGVIVFDEETKQSWRCESPCPKWLMSIWNDPTTNPWLLGMLNNKDPHQTHINALELLAILGAVWTFGETLFRDRQVIFFCDNTSAIGAVVNGYARAPHMAALSNALSLALAGLRCESWIEWVPSKANPADIPSRPTGPDESSFYEKLGSIPWPDGTKGSGCHPWPGGMIFPSLQELKKPRLF
jgi:hypothetical protein